MRESLKTGHHRDVVVMFGGRSHTQARHRDQVLDRYNNRIPGFEGFFASNAAIDANIAATCGFDTTDIGYEVFRATHFQHRKRFFRAFPFHHFGYSPYPAASLGGECYPSRTGMFNKAKCHKSFTKFHVAFFNNGVIQVSRGCVCSASTHAPNPRLYLFAPSFAQTSPRLRLTRAHSNQAQGSIAFRRLRLFGARVSRASCTETIRSNFSASFSSPFTSSSYPRGVGLEPTQKLGLASPDLGRGEPINSNSPASSTLAMRGPSHCANLARRLITRSPGSSSRYAGAHAA